MSKAMYTRIADELSALVRSGQLKGGDRLPSVRRLVGQKGVSASTAIAALRAVGIDSVMLQNPELFPSRRLQRVLVSVARRKPHLLGEYGLAYQGIDSLRHQLLRRYADIGCTVKPDEVLVTSGCTEALNLALRAVTRPGDTAPS